MRRPNPSDTAAIPAEIGQARSSLPASLWRHTKMNGEFDVLMLSCLGRIRSRILVQQTDLCWPPKVCLLLGFRGYYNLPKWLILWSMLLYPGLHTAF
jgi:hypothetical protein